MVLKARVLIFLLVISVCLFAQGRGGNQPQRPTGPWMDKSLSPDQRADLLIAQMTLEEKLQLLHGGPAGFGQPNQPTRSLGGAGFIEGISRLGIPDLQMADCAVGVTRGARYGRYSTALPSDVASAASWDLKLAYEYGALIGKELRDQGYTMSLGGGVNITREPRNGRNFEYQGEDPILAGRMVGQLIKGQQDRGVIGDIKHYAVNDQETGRNFGNVTLDKRSMRETDLLAFEIGLRDSNAGAVMCSYNRLNGDFACENSYILNDVLKKAWKFKGWVISDWGATHSTTKAAIAGLDQEMPGNQFFGDALKKAIEANEVPMSRIDDMVHRILRTEIATGVFDNPPRPQAVHPFAGAEVAQRVAEAGTVLLKNAHSTLPLAATIKSIAVIGGHADVGVISGGGSAQVDPAGGNPVTAPPPAQGVSGPAAAGIFSRAPVFHPSSPLKAIRAKAPGAKVEYNAGTDLAAAAALAKSSDVAIVFVTQYTTEGRDFSLTLPDDQDKLVSSVAAANPKTIVVLETGGPVFMPWLDNVSGVLEAWYPGIRGGEAIAGILFGDVNPSAKSVFSFPKSEADLPHLRVFTPPATEGGPPPQGMGRGTPQPPFPIDYTEGLKVGYKWYDAENKAPLVPFGFGLSYTTFAYSGLKATADKGMQVSFTVKNTGKRAGAEIAQVYVSLPSSTGEPPKRLVGWEKIPLGVGESKTVTIDVEPLFLSIFNVDMNDWQLVAGDYKVMVGGSSKDLPLTGSVAIK